MGLTLKKRLQTLSFTTAERTVDGRGSREKQGNHADLKKKLKKPKKWHAAKPKGHLHVMRKTIHTCFIWGFSKTIS